ARGGGGGVGGGGGGGAGGGPPPLAGSWLGAALGQAGGPRRPAKGAELLRRPEPKEWRRATLTRERQKISDRHGEEVVRLVTAGSPQQAHRWRQALEDGPRGTVACLRRGDPSVQIAVRLGRLLDVELVHLHGRA